MDKMPDIIYHYTRKETFLKIFAQGQTPKLRMYPVNQMNDPMECKWLLDNLSKISIQPNIHKDTPTDQILAILEN